MSTRADQPIPYAVVDPNVPVPYRVRVCTPSLELRSFVVPVLGIQPLGHESPRERPSEVRVSRGSRRSRRAAA